ncbi:hypothetical protein JCM3766R1_006064 [Sporobolomyces carnicolor]
MRTSPPVDDAGVERGQFTEEYLVLLLSDSNLPTGGFVASSGLESFIQHGYLGPSSTPDPQRGLVEFVQLSLDNYARLNSTIVKRTHRIVESFRTRWRQQRSDALGDNDDENKDEEDVVVSRLLEWDRIAEDMMLNQISKRSSIAQGNALLSLYSRALAPLPTATSDREELAVACLVEKVRSEVRKGGTIEGWRGHQSSSFGIVMAAVGLSLERSLHLFLFLHARSILSSAVRLNVIGPYSAHRLLLWDVRRLVEKAIAKEIDFDGKDETERGSDEAMSQTEDKRDWWDDDPDWQFAAPKASSSRDGRSSNKEQPVTTWPLGEIVASRHDQLFTKVFNS